MLKSAIFSDWSRGGSGGWRGEGGGIARIHFWVQISSFSVFFYCTFAKTQLFLQCHLISVSCSNPMGRTGIRGKGVLWRWGPNHVIKAVVTRWRRKYTADLLPTASYLYVEGKRVLEFITVPKNEFSEGLSEVNYGLPGVSNFHISMLICITSLVIKLNFQRDVFISSWDKWADLFSYWSV